jgi:molybdopterin-guanine dinucleotide biosynthesis protein A
MVYRETNGCEIPSSKFGKEETVLHTPLRPPADHRTFRSLSGVLPEEEAAGFVLAGGQSSRMGRDKALLELAGQPLAAHALAQLQEAGLAAKIAGAAPTARSSLAAFASVIDDTAPGRGPLSGVCAALAATTARHAVFLPVDLPLLPASLLVFLLRRAQITGSPITVTSVSGFVQTFPAVIDRAVLPVLQNELDSGRYGCFSTFQVAVAAMGQQLNPVAVELLVQAGEVFHPLAMPPLYWFLNLNSPGDLARAEELQGRR